MNVHPVRRNLKHFALLSFLGLVVAGLSQCRMVNDNVTGVDLTAQSTVGSHSDCIRRCEEGFKDKLRDEDGRYDRDLRSCGRDRDCQGHHRHNHDCRVDKHKDDLKDCKRKCYNEGNGSGGR